MPTEIDPAKVKWDPIDTKAVTWDESSTANAPEVPEWGKNNPNLYGVAGAAYETLSPLAEVGGMVAGGIAGAPGGPLTSAAGAGLGYGIAKRIKQIAAEALGIKPKETVGEAFKEGARDVLEGATLQAGGELAGKAIGAAASKVAAPFVKNITPEAREIAALAEKEGVPLTAAEITQSSALSKIENALSMIPGSSGIIQKQRVNQIQKLINLRERLLDQTVGGQPIPPSVETIGVKIKNAVDNFVASKKGIAENEALAIKDDLLKSLGSKETYETVGMNTRQLVSKKSQKFYGQMKTSFNELGAELPQDSVIPTTNLQSKAKEILEAELKKPVGLRRKKETLDTLKELSGASKEVDEILNNPNVAESMKAQLRAEMPKKEYDWQSIQGMRSDLGTKIAEHDAAFQTKERLTDMLSSPEAGVFKQLKGALQKDVDSFMDGVGGDIGEKYKILNKVYGEGKELYGSKEILGILKSNPEKVVDLIFKPDRVTEIRQLKKVIGDQNFEPLTKSFISVIFDDVSRGGFTWGKVADKFAGYGKEMMAQAIPNEANRKTLFNMIQQGVDGEALPVTEKFVQDILKKSTPETIMNVIFHPNNAANVSLTKGIVGKDLFNQAKEKFTEKLLAQNEVGLFRPLTTLKNISKMDEPTLKTIYTKEEYEALNNIGKISKLSQGADRLAGNPSGTGQAILTFEAGKALLKNPVTGGYYWIVPPVLAKMYLSNVGRKYLTEGFKMSATSPQAISLTTKIMSIAGLDATE